MGVAGAAAITVRRSAERPERPPLRFEHGALPVRVAIFACRFPQKILGLFRWCFWGSLRLYLLLEHRQGVPRPWDGKSSVDVVFYLSPCHGLFTGGRKLSGNLLMQGGGTKNLVY